MRQNPVLHEAFFINTQNAEFKIALNPLAQIGDTIYFHNETYKVLSCNLQHDLGSFVVTKLDSTIIDGNYRKVLELIPVYGSNPYFYSFTAGVGFTGIVYGLDGSYGIICRSSESNLIIGSPFNSWCDLDVEENVSPKFQIFPNPTEGVAFFQPHLIDIQSFNLYNADGRNVMAEKYTLDSESIDMCSLATGIYVLEIQFESKILIKKLVKMY